MSECYSTSKNNGIKQRAAEIRQQWSPVERARRVGLPPDMPHRLRDHLVGRPECNLHSSLTLSHWS